LRLVVIDDDPKNLKFVTFILASTGLEIHTASDPQAGMDLIRRLRPHIVLMDLVMPGVQGMELLQKVVEFDPGIDVILMTGYYSTESAVEAIQKGAADYFPKPFSPEKLRQRIALIVEDAKRRQRSSTLENELLENFQFEGIIGRSPLMLDLFSKIRIGGPGPASVERLGEALRGRQLLLNYGKLGGKRALWTRKRIIYRSQSGQGRRFRICRRGNRAFRRDRRNAFGDAGQIVASLTES
jgi:DNA-binding NtrC family response regulator